ncbi:MAG: hypothetical protein K2Y31_11430 [Burkholderiales bacterium]|nr:hypothetical protein [Burkholderiales bacterium]
MAEYELARTSIVAFHGKTQGIGIHFITRASGHFESCIWSLERFIKHAKALRSATFIPADLRDLVPRQSSFLQSPVEKQITRMRHTLAHLEGEALKGLLPQGSNIILLAIDRGLSVGGHIVEWKELIAWLQDVHATGAALADYLPQRSKRSP